MKGKKEEKRYMFAIKLEDKEYVFSSEKDFKSFYREYYDSLDNKSRILYVNLRVERSNTSKLIYVAAEKLLRLESFKRPLEDIDALTTYFSEEEIKEILNVQNNSNPIVVAYRAKGKIYTLPVFYKDKREFFRYESLKEIIVRESVLNPSFLDTINVDRRFNSDLSIASFLRNVFLRKSEYISSLSWDSDKSGALKYEMVGAVERFIYAWCHPKNKNGKNEFSYRKFRDLAAFTINVAVYPKQKTTTEEKRESSEIKEETRVSAADQNAREQIEQLSFLDSSYKLKGGNQNK